MRSPLAAVLLLCAAQAFAVDPVRTKAPVRSGPRTTPIVTTPAININPNLGVTPGINTSLIPNSGVGVNAAVNPALTATGAQKSVPTAVRPAAAVRPGAAAAARDGERAAGVPEVDQPGKTTALSSPTQTPAKKGSELESVRGVGGQIEQSRRVEAQDGGAATKAVLDSSFEARKAVPGGAAGAANALSGAPSFVSGRGQTEVGKALSVAALASQPQNTPAASAPALFGQSMRTLQEGMVTETKEGKATPQSQEGWRAAGRHVQNMAFARAKEEIAGDSERPGLANAGLLSASRGEEKEAKAAKSSLEEWQGLFGIQWRPLTGREKPLIQDLGAVTEKIDKVRAEAAKAGPGAKIKIPRVNFTERDGVLVHNLKPELKSVAPLALSLAQSPLPLSLRRELAAAGGLRQVYDEGESEGGSGGVLVSARYSVAYAARAVWRSLTSAVLAVAGRVVTTTAEVGGVTLRSRDFALKRLAAFGRAPAAAESSAAAGARLVGLDLSRIVKPADAALAALSASGLTVGGLSRALADAESLAAGHRALTGEADGPAVIAAWKALAARATTGLSAKAAAPAALAKLASSGERKDGLAYWVERLRRESLDHIDRQMLAVLRKEGGSAIIVSDPASGQARLVALSAPAGLSARLSGFTVEESGPALRAYREGPGASAALAAAAEALRGGPAPAEAKALARALREVSADRARARRQARRAAAEDPALSGFVPYAAVVDGGRAYLVERGARGGIVLRDADTLDLEFALAR